jgi:endonuclease YncB( thermonuclease family)
LFSVVGRTDLRRKRMKRGFLTMRALLAILLVTMMLPTVVYADEDRSQPRPSGERIEVPLDGIAIDDGDTITIDWSDDDQETVRILGIDTPETQHIEHNILFDQPFGREAAGFAKGAFGVATKVELLRASMMDPYDRTLGYLFINGRNYSAMILKAGLAVETVSHYGDNGLPEEAAVCLTAAKDYGPAPFEPPYLYRKRMREVSRSMREKGLLPELEESR